MKKIICLLLALGLLCLSGCQFGKEGASSQGPSEGQSAVSSEGQSDEAVSSQPEALTEDGKGELEYDSLNHLQQSIYDRILTASNDLNTGMLEIPSASTMEDIQESFSAVTSDNPGHFWLQKSFEITTQGDKVYVTLRYLVDSMEQKEEMQKQLSEAMDSILKSIPADADDFTKELMIHDWLLNRVSYSDEAAADTTGGHASAYTVYGAIVEQKAVCEGYARSMQLLLNKVNVPCALISGVGVDQAGKSSDHMWNIVTVDGQKYHLDATWNDAVLVEGEQSFSHIYFNVTDDVISADHKDFESPGCKDDDANYYVRQNRSFDFYDETTKSAIQSAMVEGATDRNRVLEFQFTNEEAYNAAYHGLVEDQDVFALLKGANEGIGSTVLREDLISYGAGDPANRVITLVVSYVE